MGLPPKPWPTGARQAPQSPSIGDVLRAGVARARTTWWQKLACRTGVHHPYPRHLTESGTQTCQRCGRTWVTWL